MNWSPLKRQRIRRAAPNVQESAFGSEDSKVRASFCEQKEAKKLRFRRVVAWTAPKPALNKSFLLLFFKKEALSCLS
jgi:hypothetical protein